MKAEKINKKIKQKIEDYLAECEKSYREIPDDDKYKDMLFGELQTARYVANLIKEVEQEADNGWDCGNE